MPAYNNAVPATGHSPAQDYVAMQQNYATIQTAFDVEHVDFTVPNSFGQHKQVTFNQNIAAPGIVNAVAAEYVNSAVGIFGNLSTLFFQNATQILPLTNLPLVSNGVSGTNYGIRTPWGLIINFGEVSSGSATHIPWGIAFPNAFYSIVSGINQTNGTATATFFGVNQTEFSVKSPSINAVWYIAIGS